MSENHLFFDPKQSFTLMRNGKDCKLIQVIKCKMRWVSDICRTNSIPQIPEGMWMELKIYFKVELSAFLLC